MADTYQTFCKYAEVLSDHADEQTHPEKGLVVSIGEMVETREPHLRDGEERIGTRLRNNAFHSTSVTSYNAEWLRSVLIGAGSCCVGTFDIKHSDLFIPRHRHSTSVV